MYVCMYVCTTARTADRSTAVSVHIVVYTRGGRYNVSFQHRIIFPLILQTLIIVRMLSIVEEGFKKSKHLNQAHRYKIQ